MTCGYLNKGCVHSKIVGETGFAGNKLETLPANYEND